MAEISRVVPGVCMSLVIIPREEAWQQGEVFLWGAHGTSSWVIAALRWGPGLQPDLPARGLL